MGDIGYFDSLGRLWMCGRKSHRVVLEDHTLYTIPCERIFNTHPAVYRTALVGVKKNNTTIPVLCVELNERGKKISVKQIMDELTKIAQSNDMTRSIEVFLIHPAFPTDIRHNAKIFREQLAQWAERKV